MKYAYALDARGIDYSFISWDRNSDFSLEDNHFKMKFSKLYNRRAGVGKRWGNLLNIIGWNIFLFKALFSSRRAIDVVHVVDLESALTAYIFCKLFNIPIVYDIYDHYAESRLIGGIFGKLVSRVERFIAENSDVLILADKSRVKQHKLQKVDNLLIIENVPDLSIDKVLINDSLAHSGRGRKIRIGYLGVLEKESRGLENFILAVSKFNDIELHIAGYGLLEEMVSDYSSRFDNIKWYGRLEYHQGLRLLSEMDCVLGLYYLSIPNHKYAAPNKYYEHLMLGKAMITTDGTPPGDKVRDYNTGWAIGDSINNIIELLDFISLSDIEIKSKNAYRLWMDNYSNYSTANLVEKYVNRVLEISC